MICKDRSKKIYHDSHKELKQKHSSISRGKYAEDPLSNLYQLDQDVTIIDKEDLFMITRIFDDIEEFHKFMYNIKNLISEDSLIEEKIINFFKNAVKSVSIKKYTLEQKDMDEGIEMRRNMFFRLIFEFPEVLKERMNRLDSGASWS